MTTKNKKDCARLGGLATVKKYGRTHMAQIGKKGAAVTWQRYHLAPHGLSDFAMTNRTTGEIKALISGRRP